MARRSLRPQLNQIRTWVRQGRTDAWIAHQLEATVQQITAFKAENDLTEATPDDLPASPVGDVDLRAEDEAAIAKALEEEAKRRAEEAAKAEAEAKAKAEAEAKAKAEAGDSADEDQDEDDDESAAGSRRRRRGRRGGRGRKAGDPSAFEGTFDHGDEGYGLWLDPAVADSGVYAEHWAGHRPVEVVVEADQIVIRRIEPGKPEAAASDTTADA